MKSFRRHSTGFPLLLISVGFGAGVRHCRRRAAASGASTASRGYRPTPSCREAPGASGAEGWRPRSISRYRGHLIRLFLTTLSFDDTRYHVSMCVCVIYELCLSNNHFALSLRFPATRRPTWWPATTTTSTRWTSSRAAWTCAS